MRAHVLVALLAAIAPQAAASDARAQGPTGGVAAPITGGVAAPPPAAAPERPPAASAPATAPAPEAGAAQQDPPPDKPPDPRGEEEVVVPVPVQDVLQPGTRARAALPRTGAPLHALAALGFSLLFAGIAARELAARLTPR